MTSLGLPAGTVKLARYADGWRRKFQAEARRLAARLAPRRYRIEHIGSTSVPGLDAKPIIDIAVRIPSFRTLDAWIDLLIRAGYEYKGEYGLPGRHFFTRGAPVTQHLHLVTHGATHWEDWLLFRDFLRVNHDAAEQYNRTKRELARRFSRDRAAYTRAKSPLVRKLMRDARRWRARS